ncbi:enoyl-CoA hydratase/isomerase family protein [Rhodoferax sp.]|uniref:enoyl-CoA hydratase/isomerase family protein n=1 Tax=Rhodoferax sp. TaxID=50421 RepID=UPI00272028EF|nr:enoyl-CoA hydratase/isomerase family protein [Rhodoferax sp.]MDO8318292.1 enoyl-CoA hydratase/isomerase family protein [Rhodoferax sp.]
MFKVEDLGAVVRVTMQRAPVNAISTEFVAGFMQVLDGLAAKTDLTVLHLRSDQKAFCAGADLAQVQSCFAMDNGAEMMRQNIRGFHALFDRIEALPGVTLAEIGGSALGGGFELALSCDLRMVSTSAKLGLPEAKLGLIPGAGGTQRLTRLCGPGTAARIILGCDVVDGTTACQLGMVQWAVAPEKLAQEAQALVQRIAAQSAPALQLAKHCMAQVGRLAAEGFDAELNGIHTLVTTVEAQTRVKAFLAPRN